MPPGQTMDDYLTICRSGMWRLNYRLSPEGKRRFFTEFLPLLHDTMHATLGPRESDTWYLVYLGTRLVDGPVGELVLGGGLALAWVGLLLLVLPSARAELLAARRLLGRGDVTPEGAARTPR